MPHFAVLSHRRDHLLLHHMYKMSGRNSLYGDYAGVTYFTASLLAGLDEFLFFLAWLQFGISVHVRGDAIVYHITSLQSSTKTEPRRPR